MQFLKNIFAPEKQNSIRAIVVRKIRTGLYQLTDDAGKPLQADAAKEWPLRSVVIVQSGRIVATAETTSVKTYEV